jgi:hypothetical protein
MPRSRVQLHVAHAAKLAGSALKARLNAFAIILEGRIVPSATKLQATTITGQAVTLGGLEARLARAITVAAKASRKGIQQPQRLRLTVRRAMTSSSTFEPDGHAKSNAYLVLPSTPSRPSFAAGDCADACCIPYPRSASAAGPDLSRILGTTRRSRRAPPASRPP